MREKGGQHGQVTSAQLVVTNQCFHCNTTFKSIASAKGHVRSAMNKGRCPTIGAREPRSRQAVRGELNCKLCGEVFDEREGEGVTERIDRYHEHLKQMHLELSLIHI